MGIGGKKIFSPSRPKWQVVGAVPCLWVLNDDIFSVGLARENNVYQKWQGFPVHFFSCHSHISTEMQHMKGNMGERGL